MLDETSKKKIVWALIVAELLICIFMFSCLTLSHSPEARPISSLIFIAKFNLWGWALLLGLGIAAIVTIFRWKANNIGFNIFGVLLSILSIIFSGLWAFGLYFITHLNP